MSDTLKELAERVERGETFRLAGVDDLARTLFGLNFTFSDWGLVKDASEGSIDASAAIVTKVLPDWTWSAGTMHSEFLDDQAKPAMAELAGPITWVQYDGPEEPEYQSAYGTAATPAAALLAALLRAKAAP